MLFRSGKPALLAEFVKMGALYVSAGSDLQFLMSAATERSKLLADKLR